MIYLDNSATTRPNEACVAAMNELLTECWFNPSSVYRPGMDAAHRLKTARAQVAQALGAETERVFFTSGGTEADNWAIFSTAKRLGKRGRHIVTTAVEHHAVLHPMQQLEAQGFEVTYLQPDETGFVSVETLKAALRPDTILVSIMMVNNESGAVMPIADMVRATRRLAPLALFHTDAVQGFLKVPFKAKTLGADLISISGHKVHGPKGVGVLYARKGIILTNIIEGGAQERGKRAGTENIPGIVGMAAALKDMCEHIDENAVKVSALRDKLIAGLAKIPHSILNGDPVHRLPGNVNFCFEGIEGESLLLLLDDKGICASSGSACTSGSLDPSHVLLAIGRPHEVAHGSLRLSLSEWNTEEEVDYMLKAIPEVVEYLRGMSPVWQDLVNGKRSFVLA
mgnify:CR=1 FL=1